MTLVRILDCHPHLFVLDFLKFKTFWTFEKYVSMSVVDYRRKNASKTVSMHSLSRYALLLHSSSIYIDRAPLPLPKCKKWRRLWADHKFSFLWSSGQVPVAKTGGILTSGRVKVTLTRDELYYLTRMIFWGCRWAQVVQAVFRKPLHRWNYWNKILCAGMSFRKRGEVLNDRGSGPRSPLVRGTPRTSSMPLRAPNRRVPGNFSLPETTAILKKLNIADEPKTASSLDSTHVGIRPSPATSQPTTSTGSADLDNILGHMGLPLGNSLLVEEQTTTEFHSILGKLFAAQGIVHNRIADSGADKIRNGDTHVIVLSFNQMFAKELPGIYKGSRKQVKKTWSLRRNRRSRSKIWTKLKDLRLQGIRIWKLLGSINWRTKRDWGLLTETTYNKIPSTRTTTISLKLHPVLCQLP